MQVVSRQCFLFISTMGGAAGLCAVVAAYIIARQRRVKLTFLLTLCGWLG